MLREKNASIGVLLGPFVTAVKGIFLSTLNVAAPQIREPSALGELFGGLANVKCAEPRRERGGSNFSRRRARLSLAQVKENGDGLVYRPK